MEKRQHTFLRDGRQALEGKLNLSKDAVGALRKDWRFVSKYMYSELALFTRRRFFFLFLFLFIVDSFNVALNAVLEKLALQGLEADFCIRLEESLN